MMYNFQIFRENPERFKNPRFYFKFVDEEGKKHRKLCPAECKTYEEAKRYVNKLSFSDENCYLIRNIAAEMFLENSMHLQRLSNFGKNLSTITVKLKRYYIKLIISQFGNRNIFELKTSEIEDLLIKDTKHSNSWKNSYLETFGNIYEETEWLNKRCPKPSFHRFVRNSKKADIFQIEELKEFFNIAYWTSYDEWLLFRIIFFCGLRLSEARALRPCQFYWDNKIVVINGFCKANGQRTNYNKKGSIDNPKTRIVILPDELITQLKIYINQNQIDYGDFIFKYNDKPYRRELLEKDFKRVLARSKIKINERKLVPHSLRFTYVSLMRRNVDVEQVQKFAGHNSVQMTDYYTRFNIENSIDSIKKESFEAVNNLLHTNFA